MADCIVRGSSMDGAIRVFVAITTDLVNEAQRIHKSYPVSTAALGRTLTGAAIMGACLKNETDTVTIQIKGDGLLGSIVAVTDSSSAVRGYVVNPFVELPPNEKGKLDVGGAVGKGYLSVVRDLGLKEPYVGQVPLVTGEIAEDLTYYYATSEQIPTAMALGVLVDTDNTVICSGGFMIQLMPEATDDVAQKIEENLKKLPSVTEMIQDGLTIEDIFFEVTYGFNMLMENKTTTPVYKCKCSKERMEKALISIGRQELEDLINEQHEAEMTCQFCDNRYTFNQTELEELLASAR